MDRRSILLASMAGLVVPAAAVGAVPTAATSPKTSVLVTGLADRMPERISHPIYLWSLNESEFCAR